MTVPKPEVQAFRAISGETKAVIWCRAAGSAEAAVAGTKVIWLRRLHVLLKGGM
tara:strand:+ start:345 stop:506 length:162 start_codon:yes stop_codon:yes gene_type:complete